MNLPQLPKQNKTKEADFGIELRKKISLFGETCALEIKHTRGKKSFRLAEYKAEQIAYARKIQSEEGVLIRVQGLRGEPDYIFMKKEPSFVVIRYPKNFYIIRSEDLIKEKEKSLTEERAMALSIKNYQSQTEPCLVYPHH